MIHYTCDSDEAVLEYLIEKGADLNAKNDYGNTPLHEGSLFLIILLNFLRFKVFFLN